MAFPAQNFEDAVSNAITSSDQLYNVINGSDTDVITTDSGNIPSLRKSLVDNFFFLDPIDWLQGENSTKFNQLYKFTDGLLWFAPAATITNPIPLGASPNGDGNWIISPFSITTPVAPIQEPRQFGDGVNVTFSTPSTIFVQPSSVIVRLDGIYQSSLDDYTIDASGNVVFTSGIPATGVFVDITLYNPVVTENPSELNILATGSTTPRMLKDRFADVVNVKDFGAQGDGVTDDSSAIVAAAAAGINVYFPTGNYVWDTNISITAKDKHTFFCDEQGSVSIDMKSDGIRGGYRFIIGNSVTDVTIRNLKFTGDRVRLEDTSNSGYPTNLFSFTDCDNLTLENLHFFEWFHYYPINEEFQGQIVFILRGDNVQLKNLQFNECGNEHIFMLATTNSSLDNGRFYNTQTDANFKMFTACHQQPYSVTNDVTTARNNALTNLIIEGAIGSAYKIGGVGARTEHVTMRNVRKGLIMDNEQMPDPSLVTTKHEDIYINNITAIANTDAGGIGLGFADEAEFQITRAQISNIVVRDFTQTGMNINNIEELDLANVEITNCNGIGYRAGMITDANVSNVRVTTPDNQTNAGAGDIAFYHRGTEDVAPNRSFARFTNVRIQRFAETTPLTAPRDVFIWRLTDCHLTNCNLLGQTKAVEFQHINGDLSVNQSIIDYTNAPTSIKLEGTSSLNDVVFRDSTIRNYNDAAFRINATTVLMKQVRWLDCIFEHINPAGHSGSHVVLGATAIERMRISGCSFSDTTATYGCVVTAGTGSAIIYVENNMSNATILFDNGAAEVGLSVFPTEAPNADHTYRIPLIMGNGYLWVDSTGDLRISTNKPTSDLDGSIVGTQS